MNIFEYNDILKRQQNPLPAPGQGPGAPYTLDQLQGGGQRPSIGTAESPYGNIANYGAEANTGKAPPTLPEMLGGGGRESDVSAMASYGMEAPPLQDPMLQLKGLMGMNANQPRQQSQGQQGGLMAYLLSLGGI